MSRYTQARLEYALKVFRDSLPYRAKRGFKTDNLEQQLKKYALRTPTSTTVAQRSTLWIDKDDSGNYDPSKAKKRHAVPRPTKPRSNKRKEPELGADGECGGPSKKAKAKAKPKKTWQSGRKRGDEYKIALKLTTDVGKVKFRQLVDASLLAPEIDDQPSLWALGGGSLSRSPRNPLSSAARRRSMFGSDPESDDENEDHQVCGLGLRTRTLPVAEDPGIPQKPPRCLPCREAKRKCTHKKSDPGPSCTQCRRDGLECRLGTPKVENGEKAEPVTPGDHHECPITIDSPSSASLDTRWITTSFVHPINFRFSAAQDPTKTCDFCRDYRFGMIGCGKPKTVEVIVEGSRIIEEMGDGYRAEGREPTNMCIMCALDRFQICRCATHDIVPIAGSHSNDFDYAEAYRSLSTLGAPASNHWCNFCISPAFFACRAPQQYSKVGQQIVLGSKMEKGCGLLLCPACAAVLHQVGMNRAKFEEQVRGRGNWKARADMEFLFHGSDLHKAYEPQ